MKPRTHNRVRTEHGQSLVELAISLVVLLVLLSGGVSFGMALFSYVALRDAAQEGALYGSFNPCVDSSGDGHCQISEPVNVAGVQARIRASSTSPIDFSNTTVIPDAYITVASTNSVSGAPHACEGNVNDAGGNPIPNAIQVTVEYDYPIFMPFVGAIVGGQQIHLTATVTDTILEPRCEP